MNNDDRQIAAWLAEGPDQGRRAAGSRPGRDAPDVPAAGLDLPERWLPMQLTIRRPLVPRAVVYLALLALLIATRRGGAPGAWLPAGPGPLGAANGSVAYDAGGQLYVANPDGSGPRPLPQADKYAYSPAYSPDGSRIAYWSNDTPDRLQLFVAAADGTGATMVSEVSFDSNTVRAPIWTPDGRWLVYAGRDGACTRSRRMRARCSGSPAAEPDGLTGRSMDRVPL